MALVIHTMAGFLAGSDSWFNSPNNTSQSSAHFGVGLDGAVHQYVRLAESAHANGIVTPGNRWVPRFGSTWVNGRTISIETEDSVKDGTIGAAPVTDALNDSVLRLCREVILPAEPNLVLTSHHIIDPINRPNCCGKRWTNGRIQALGKALGLEVFI